MSTATAPRKATLAKSAKDAVLIGAVELARESAEAIAGPGEVGDYIGVSGEGERLVLHSFASLAKGYRGWRWAVTVARAPRSKVATICETALLPGDDSLLAPQWVPYAQRLRPGDVGPSDTLPFLSDDDRLEQGYEAMDDDPADEVAVFELGLGRKRVISPIGLVEAADRWYAGDQGPSAPAAVAAKAPCSTCGFLLRLGGPLRQVFGVCANEWSPQDGSVVSLDHGCGAHSETDVPEVASEWPDSALVIDDSELEFATIEQVAAGDDESQAQVGVANPSAVVAAGGPQGSDSREESDDQGEAGGGEGVEQS